MSQPYVEIREGDKSRNLILTGHQLSIGRQIGVDLVLPDNLLSRQHCVIEVTPDGWQVRDLKSRNGTAVNGKLITSQILKGGDVIKVGTTFITFRDPQVVEDEEMLSADDLVPVIEEAPEPKASKSPLSARMSDDPDEALETLARSMPDQSFSENDIQLYSARGTIMHAAKKTAQKGKREAVDLFRLLLLICIRSRTTDIHLEPHQGSYGIRLRVDGVMADVAKLPLVAGVKIATLVKVLSDIDIAQRNTIQEGRFSSQTPRRTGGGVHKIDYRVSFAPAVNGQKLVIRILDEDNAPALLPDLKMPKWMEHELAEQIKQDAGMVLVAGPTGSGKTTTLYALLRSIELDQRNVVTIEDPVEMQIDQTTQMPVDEASGKTFSNILRSVLRQDPDVIMLGEIRDAETARTAMQAAITGHMVLSTVHTRDTLGTVFRLLDLGVEPYLVSQGLQIVVAQRLVRVLCPFCRRRIAPTAAQRTVLNANGQNPDYVYTAVGCLKCLDTGHAGRRAVFELLVSTDRLRDAMQRPNLVTGDLQKAVEGTQFTSLGQSGFQLVVDGIASFEEVERISGRGNRGE